MRAAAVQLNSGADIDANIAAATEVVAAAAADGAELIVLPEKWSLLGAGEELVAGAESLEGRAISAARGWAADHGVAIVAGSVAEPIAGEERVANTSVLIDPAGEIVAGYRKVHMFDVEVEGQTYRESEHELPGEELVLAPVGSGGLELGLSVCYDLRFPELYRLLALAGARVVTVPSAFTRPTGRAHWEVLLRARAIENQMFVIAPNQTGTAEPHYDSWGHSMIVDPWGEILADAGEGVGHIAADLDLDRLEQVRRDLPSLANRREQAYRLSGSEVSHA